MIKRYFNQYNFATWLQSQWQVFSIWHLILAPVSWLYFMVITVRKWLYQEDYLKHQCLPVPVVVVGNINVGGSGKTPLVIYLAQALRDAGFSPGIISRGYGGDTKSTAAVTAESNPQFVGDEAVLIAQKTGFPVYVDLLRVNAGLALLNAHPKCNLIISDDGLQHYGLHRDIEIAVVDGNAGFGNGGLLPAGPLREPIDRLDTVDAIVVNGVWLGDERALGKNTAIIYDMALIPAPFYQLNNVQEKCQAIDFKGMKLHAIAGIGCPDRFFRQLKELFIGCDIELNCQAFLDHHAFSLADFSDIHADAIIMTEKDAVKCRQFKLENAWVLPVRAELDVALVEMIIDQLNVIKPID